MNLRYAYLVLAVVLAACSKDNLVAPVKDNPVAPVEDEWAFPASSKFAITLLADKATIAVGQTTGIKVVLYNVTNVFGAAIELRMPLDSIEVVEIRQGPAFPATESPLIVSKVDSALDKVSYGVTLRAGSTAAFSGSAVVCKATVKGKTAGLVNIRITPEMLSLVKSDGQRITNFGWIGIENLVLTIN